MTIFLTRESGIVKFLCAGFGNLQQLSGSGIYPLTYYPWPGLFSACEKCLDAGIKCYKNAVLVVTVDCEEGNKQAMVSISNKVENPSLKLLVPLPDSIHVNKVQKCFGQSGHLFTNDSSNQITEKTIDFEDSTAQVP